MHRYKTYKQEARDKKIINNALHNKLSTFVYKKMSDQSLKHRLRTKNRLSLSKINTSDFERRGSQQSKMPLKKIRWILDDLK